MECNGAFFLPPPFMAAILLFKGKWNVIPVEKEKKQAFE
jgi:hypothetical protein